MFTITPHASKHPDRAAVVYGNGEFVETYGELEERSRRLAHVFGSWGLGPGDCVAVLLANDDVFYDVFWACHRAGLYFTPVNWHLQRDEVEYIVDNCDAKAFVAHARFAEVAAGVAAKVPRLAVSASVGGSIPGFRALEEELASAPADEPLGAELEGSVMLYSSGTTGRPKGVRRPLLKVPAGDPRAAVAVVGLTALFGMREGDRYLSPAPLYHAAPLTFASGQHRIGATTVIMRRFDAEDALRIIQDQKVTTSQWVPTHFKRLLSLPEAIRRRYDVSRLRVAVHAAAPCPIAVKEAMIAWWGDAIMEYYAGTEGGGTLIRAQEWLAHKGSVGRHWTNGKVHILDESGAEIDEPNREGAIYFESPPDPDARFNYYKDAAKTADTYRGDLFTIGDIGYLDADGYLYLTDRQSNMIISGGVNIYPQETESHLVTHPKVHDVAVIGVPNEEMGEEVKAVVVPAEGVEPGPALEDELIQFCRAHIAHYKCPRSIDFATELPRTETGKMQKRKLRDRYWQGHGSRLV
ncbi:MAG: acyl-CoA synthetase [Proteobacteria bacterium]|nr:MAG: acyl-CoA synthetase [Pseudomonadota bacterium]